METSPRYQALTKTKKQVVDALANAVSAILGVVVPNLSPSQKAKVVAGYKVAVDGLVAAGWLTAAQATTLKTLADAL